MKPMLKTWQKQVSLKIIYSVIENLDLSIMYRVYPFLGVLGTQAFGCFSIACAIDLSIKVGTNVLILHLKPALPCPNLGFT